MDSERHAGQPIGISRADLKWLVEHTSFESVPAGPRACLLELVRPMRVRSGRRIITQGEEGDEFFIIREGRCLVSLERDGVTQLVGRLGPGQIVGEMAILTGERRSANVDAETDMELWAIGRESFNHVCDKYPSLRRFLTKLVSERLSTAVLTSDRTIGKYIVEEIVGEGGYSFVYKGLHSGLQLPVAVKMLKHDMAMDSSFVEQFRREGRVIARLNHQNIVKVYDVEEMFRTFFIIMEYVEGEPLARRLYRDQRPSINELVDYLLQICSGLLHAHEKGVVHGDVKPGNILVDGGNRVRIVDFGFARSMGSMDQYAKGTPHYMSPEQILGSPMDERSDIYSLGIMAYEMLAGIRPCLSTDPEEILYWHLEEHVNDPGDIVPDIPEELRSFVIRATQRHPKARYRTVRQVIPHLEAVAETLGRQIRAEVDDELDMTGLFVFYRKEQRPVLQKLFRDFGQELEKVGVRLRGTSFKKIDR